MALAGDSQSKPCKKFEKDFVLYHYGEPTETDLPRLEAHLGKCASCRGFMDDLHRFLSVTARADDPPQEFWESYSREMRRKLAAIKAKISWLDAIFSLFRKRPAAALAAAFALILALTLTFSKELGQPQRPLPEGKALLEIQPVTEDLDFLKALDFLDSLDLLETVDAGKNQNPRRLNQSKERDQKL